MACAVAGSNPLASLNNMLDARKILADGSSMRSPASVGTIPAPERTKIGSPASTRRRLSAALTAGWYIPRRMAARETLRSVSTVFKTRMR